MKFFIPHAKDENQTKDVYDSIIKYAKKTLEWDIDEKAKIREIEYMHNEKIHRAEVGKNNKLNGEEVIAILKSNAYLVCTPNRGVIRGLPILVGEKEIKHIEYFDE